MTTSACPSPTAGELQDSVYATACPSLHDGEWKSPVTQAKLRVLCLPSPPSPLCWQTVMVAGCVTQHVPPQLTARIWAHSQHPFQPPPSKGCDAQIMSRGWHCHCYLPSV